MSMISLNGKLVSRNKALIPGETDGLYYGAGCFETLRSYRGTFLHFEKHLLRLKNGIQFLTDTDKACFSEEKLRKEIRDLLEINGLIDSDAKVRIQLSLGGTHGYSIPSGSDHLNMLISANVLSDTLLNTYSLATVRTRVIPSACKPSDLKLSNMLHYRQAAIEAKLMKADDALMLTTGGKVAESSIANIFWENDGTVYTPSSQCDILPGVTRQTVLKLLGKLNVNTSEGMFDSEEVLKARQVFLCNSIRELVWVDRIDGKPFATQTDLRNLLTGEFERYKEENLK